MENREEEEKEEEVETYLLFNPALSRFDTPSLETLKVIESCKKS